MFVHYYCSGSGVDKGPSYETVLRALCRRLAWNSDGTLAEPANHLYESSRSIPDVQLTVKGTWELLLQQLIDSRLDVCTVVFVFDALDECETGGDYTDLLQFLHKLPRKSKGPYFLVSSRPHVQVEKYFNSCVQVFDVVQPQTSIDMEFFIEAQLALRRDSVRGGKSIFCEYINKKMLCFQPAECETVKDPALLEKLKSALLEHAGGMYVEFQKIVMSIFPSQY